MIYGSEVEYEACIWTLMELLTGRLTASRMREQTRGNQTSDHVANRK